MTGPVIKLPTVGQEISEGLAPLLNALFARQQMGLERQRLDLEAQRTQADVAQSTQATSESKARVKGLLAEIEQKQLDLQARDAATEQFISAMTAPGGLTPENVVTARQKLIGGDKKLKGSAMLAFDAMLKSHEEQARAVAERRQSEVQANVAEQTQPEQIEAGKLTDDLARAQLAQAQTATSLNQANLNLTRQDVERDQRRVIGAYNIWQSQNTTWAQAAKEMGLDPAVGGIPPDARFVDMQPKAGGGGGNDTQRQAGVHARTMSFAAPLIDDILKRTGGLTTTATLQRSLGPKGQLLTNPTLNEDQQALLNAQYVFVNAYIYLSSGKQINEKGEAVRLMGAVLEMAGDKPGVKRQKALLRRTLVQAAWDMANGAVADPVTAADQALLAAQAQGMEGQQLDFLREMRQRATSYLRVGGAPGFVPNVSPTTPDSMSASVTRIDSMLGQMFKVGGQR